jgi:16S rRNA (guanine1516-N2)-methyltransferase
MQSHAEVRVIDVNGVVVRLGDLGASPKLLDFASQYPQLNDEREPQLLITFKEDGLHCDWQVAQSVESKPNAISKPLSYHIDIDRFVQNQHSFPAAKQGALNQALGKKTKTILDATAGWGSDALLLCSQGYNLTLLERNPIMALMLEDAMNRLANSSWAVKHPVYVPRVINANALDFFETEDIDVDCIYLDPMFPAKRKKSAAANKYMQFLQWLVGRDEDSAQLVESAINSGCQRVVVKRPNHADPLLDGSCERFSSKLLHHDVYLRTA